MMESHAVPTENTWLLQSQEDQNGRSKGDDRSTKEVSYRILPVPFLAAMAIAATAATETFAYAAILCKDPKHCRSEERKQFSGTVSIAVTIANLCSLLALGPFVAAKRRNNRVGLLSWTVCRSMGLLVLIFGALAVSGRVFEGLASDNLLHFSLNVIYVQNVDKKLIARLLGMSLSLYMAGICLAPLLAALLPTFQMSFYLAAGFFAAILAYVSVIPMPSTSELASTVNTGEQETVQQYNAHDDEQRESMNLANFWKIPFKPLQALKVTPQVILPWLSLLCYNLVQSFVFSLLLTHTTLEFGFTGRENGFLLSIAHVVAALYLFTSTFVIPRIQQIYQTRKASTSDEHLTETPDSNSRNGLAVLAIISTLFEAVSLILLGLAAEPWQMYPLVTLLALGFATPSFVKSLATTLVPHHKAADTIAALTVAEVTGGLLAPIVLGALMTSTSHSIVFFVAAGILCTSSLALVLCIATAVASGSDG